MHITKTLTAITLMGSIGTAQANLIVVQDFGTGVPLNHYVDLSMVPTRQDLNAALSNTSGAIQNAKIDMTALQLPVAQNDFTPGPVAKHLISVKLTTPIYVVGVDTQSLSWAEQNSEYLKYIHALGFMVGASSSDQVDQFEDETGLTLLPGNIEGLNALIGTSHYPFLIDHGWVTQ